LESKKNKAQDDSVWFLKKVIGLLSYWKG